MTINTPDWVKNAVFYQIFPDRFARSIWSQPSFLSSLSFEPWDAPPTFRGYKGGNLWGVIERLDYLQDLGINAIYFTPIFHAPSNHRYNTRDYYQVDPMLGGNEAFRELLDKAHQRGMRIVLDGVFNHVGRGFAFFNDVLENGDQSPWLDWFKIEGWPLSPYPSNEQLRHEYPANYACWEGHRSLPQLNHNNPAVREYIMQVAEYWIQQGIDGWRLDVPDSIKVPGFWQEFRDRVKSINPEAYIVGEIFGDASQWLDGTQFDGVMNYRFRKNTLVFAAGDRANFIPSEYLPTWGDGSVFLSAKEYYNRIKNLLEAHQWEIQLTQLNLLGSHDTARIKTVLDGNIASIKLANLLLFTFPGAPCIYYGDEVGLAGNLDPDCRRGFPPESQWCLDIFAFYQKLIALRRTYSSLRTGEYKVLLVEDDVYVFARILQQEELIIAVNTGNNAKEIIINQNNFNEKINHIYNLKTRPNRVLLVVGEQSRKIKWIDEEETSSLMIVLPPKSGIILSATV